MSLRKGILKDFNTGDYTATVQMVSSYKVYLEDIAVARNIPAAEMTGGRKVAVLIEKPDREKTVVILS